MKKIIFLIIVLILIAACENKTSLQQNSKVETTQQTQETQSVKETTQSSGEKTQAKGLKDIFAGPKVKYTADYAITAEGKTVNSRYIMDLPKFAMETNIDEGISKSIFDGTTYYVCSMTDTEWQCFKMPMQNPDTVETEKSVNDGTATTEYIGTCSQAGESGLKYSITSKGETSTVCYTSDGILLETITSEMSMVATKVSRTVAADAFIPPAEPVDIPNLPY